MLSVKKKCVPLQSQSGNKTIADIKLGYGVMVTLQILVLSFLVRVRVPQLLLTTVLQRVKQSFCFYLKKGFRNTWAAIQIPAFRFSRILQFIHSLKFRLRMPNFYQVHPSVLHK